MADKRKPPDAPEAAQTAALRDTGSGPRGKKRAAPTIDLTATEMPAQSNSPSEPPPIAAEPPSAGADEIAAKTADFRRREHVAMALIGGVASGAVVTLAFVALWLSGLVPASRAPSSDTSAQIAALAVQVRDLKNRPAAAADPASIDALAQRVSKIENTISRLSAGDAGVAERLTVADSAMKSLAVALATLNRRSDDIAANASQARERADAAAKAVTDLQANVQDAAKISSAGISPADLEALQKRISALEQSIEVARADIAKASAADSAARLTLSAAGLRDAVFSGAPFTAELAQAESLGASDEVLAPLAQFAATGVPTAQALARELHALLPVMLKISGAPAPQGGFLERLQANAGKLVRIRPLGAPPGNDLSAVLGRLEIDTAKADIAASLADLGKLADATRAPAQGWIEKAKARQVALAAARQLATDTARALGPKGRAQ